MQQCLASLVAASPPEAFKVTHRFEKDETKQRLLLAKGVYLYEYMDSFERFSEVELPSKSAFFSKLTGEGMTDANYEHAQEVWRAFDIKNLEEYHNLYLNTDVVLRADVFESFRKTCMRHYGLNPAHYYSAPGFSWNAPLKHSKAEIQLLRDYDMHLFVEKGMRVGISTVGSKRYSKANNPYVEGYDPEKPTKYITYLGTNNLYGWAIS